MIVSKITSCTIFFPLDTCIITRQIHVSNNFKNRDTCLINSHGQLINSGNITQIP